jgi:hypothetical protein
MLTGLLSASQAVKTDNPALGQLGNPAIRVAQLPS